MELFSQRETKKRTVTLSITAHIILNKLQAFTIFRQKL